MPLCDPLVIGVARHHVLGDPTVHTRSSREIPRMRQTYVAAFPISMRRTDTGLVSAARRSAHHPDKWRRKHVALLDGTVSAMRPVFLVKQLAKKLVQLAGIVASRCLHRTLDPVPR
jgi:hypothetical protein